MWCVGFVTDYAIIQSKTQRCGGSSRVTSIERIYSSHVLFINSNGSLVDENSNINPGIADYPLEVNTVKYEKDLKYNGERNA